VKGAGWNRRRLARIFNIHLLISPEGRKTCSPRFQPWEQDEEVRMR